MRNLLLSKKLKRSETRILVIDDNQIRYNEILEIFNAKNHPAQAFLLDDLKTFEKQLNTSWDLIVFGRAYDLKIEQALALIQSTSQIDIPVLLFTPDDYQEDQYQAFIHKGIYDVVSLNHHENFYINILRALSYSRTVQAQQNLLNDLENAKLQTQVLVEEQNKAVATIEEGIHTDANQEYLTLFGLNSVDDLIGLPLLDIIQPKKLTDFKNRFKKVSQGQFEFGRFEVETLNTQAKAKNPLKIEFIPSEEEDAVQLTIETASSASSQSVATGDTTPNTFAKVHRFLKNQPAKHNALVIFSLATCPDSILTSDWNTFKSYFAHLAEFIKDQTNGTVFEISSAMYATILQAESIEIINSRLSGLNALEKPQLVTINQQTYQQQVKLGYDIFDADLLTEDSFEQLIEKAYNTRLPKDSSASDLELAATLQDTEISLSPIEHEETTPSQPINLSLVDEPQQVVETVEVPLTLAPQPEETPTEVATEIVPEVPIQLETAKVANETSLIYQLQKALDAGEIQLKYQQLYDKQDTNLHTYEVTSGFIYNNEWKKISNLIDLNEDPELSIKIDRWILVEACKKLHNFITQYPQAKLIVNLNRHSLLQDKQLPALVAKLITIVGSTLSHPLILQFDEEDLAKNLSEASKAIASLRENGAEISVRRFGSTISSENILKQTDISYLSLDENAAEQIGNEETLQELQQKIESYLEIKPVEILLKNLNEISTFANAWNVEARFLQGDYFQKKLDHLTDVQDQ